jgi:hypothetical protein
LARLGVYEYIKRAGRCTAVPLERVEIQHDTAVNLLHFSILVRKSWKPDAGRGSDYSIHLHSVTYPYSRFSVLENANDFAMYNKCIL